MITVGTGLGNNKYLHAVYALRVDETNTGSQIIINDSNVFYTERSILLHRDQNGNLTGDWTFAFCDYSSTVWDSQQLGARIFYRLICSLFYDVIVDMTSPRTRAVNNHSIQTNPLTEDNLLLFTNASTFTLGVDAGLFAHKILSIKGEKYHEQIF